MKRSARYGFAILVATGCATTRSPEQYRDDTHTLLERRSTRLEECYDKALAATPDVAGHIMIHFVVQKGTGNVVHPVVDPDESRAPDALVACVRGAVDGLRLDPPDSREGHATFVYEFKPRVDSSSTNP